MSVGWTPPFRCANCGRPHPAQGFPYRCPVCTGPFDLASFDYVPPDPAAERRGLSRWRASLPLPPEAELVSLGEGGTPLLAAACDASEVHLKCEHLNPTGSFKDRGASVLVSALCAAGVAAAVEDSSGNAGAAFAAYAARAGLRATVYIPASASGPKRAQIQAYGAEVVSVPGPRSKASEAVLEAVSQGAVYASHAYLPHVLAGVATIAFELCEQLGRAPGSVIAPAGQGSILLGLRYGFEALERAGRIARQPRLIGVQAQACAPLWAAQTAGLTGLGWVQEQETLAEGIRILRPVRGDAVLAAVESSSGTFVAVSEIEIRRGVSELARRGFYVEPTSAVVWPALTSLAASLPGPIAAILTGSGMKSPAPWND